MSDRDVGRQSLTVPLVSSMIILYQALGTFKNRKSLPEPWRGIRDEELSKLSDIEGCVFVHASGFIGGNRTKKGVMEMAVKALEI